MLRCRRSCRHNMQRGKELHVRQATGRHDAAPANERSGHPSRALLLAPHAVDVQPAARVCASAGGCSCFVTAGAVAAVPPPMMRILVITVHNVSGRGGRTCGSALARQCDAVWRQRGGTAQQPGPLAAPIANSTDRPGGSLPPPAAAC